MLNRGVIDLQKRKRFPVKNLHGIGLPSKISRYCCSLSRSLSSACLRSVTSLELTITAPMSWIRQAVLADRFQVTPRAIDALVAEVERHG